jgi:hypothetical protein
MSVGIPLEKNGNRHKHKQHDSLVFTENMYYWNSRQEKGNSVDYLVKHMDMKFPQAVFALIHEPTAIIQYTEQPQEYNFDSSSLKLSKNTDKTIKYLRENRSIGYNIIQYITENHLLMQEKRTQNAIFPIYDENDVMVGAELQGTNPSERFKGIKAGSKSGYGFNVRLSNENTFDYVLFLESAIDLISFMDCKLNFDDKPLNNCLLISMAGLKPSIVKHTLKAFNGKLQAVLCVDNDEAGQNFIDKIREENIPFITRLPDERFKDWNEQIKAIRGSTPIERLMKNCSIDVLQGVDKPRKVTPTLYRNPDEIIK